MLKNTLDKILNWFLPHICALCHAKSNNDLPLCTACKMELPWFENGCSQCGNSFLFSMTQPMKCGSCLQQPPPFDNTIILFHYQEPITKLITQLKFGHKLAYANLLGQLFSKHLEHYYMHKTLPQAIIPVPLHHKRLRERGYNQTVEIARPIVKALKIPLLLNACQKIKATSPQSLLPATQRPQNIKNAFIIRSELAKLSRPISHVAILDDVVTTGSTITELSKVLRRAGIEKIDVWCCAHTQLK